MTMEQAQRHKNHAVATRSAMRADVDGGTRNVPGSDEAPASSQRTGREARHHSHKTGTDPRHKKHAVATQTPHWAPARRGATSDWQQLQLPGAITQLINRNPQL